MLHPAESESDAAPGALAGEGRGILSPHRRPAATDLPGRQTTADGEQSPYGRSFWLAYLSLAALMIGVSLMYRYADFITFLGGGEMELGMVVGAGMVGSLLMRFAQGMGIDRYGTRHVWLASAALFVVAMLGHLLVSRSGGIAIYLLQAMYRTSIAGVFGAAFTFVFQQVPIPRMTEAVGTVGTASFVGMIVGPRIGDLISAGDGQAIQRQELDWLFLVAAALGCVSFVAAWFATSRENRRPPSRRIPLIPLLRRYHPGVLLMIGVVTGLATGMPSIFLRTFTAELHFNRLGPFFTGFALTAIVTRFATRRMAEQFGIRVSILIGMALMVAAAVSYLLVAAEWQLLLPAFLTGAGQAVLYPAVVAGGSTAFPGRYRGMGTIVMLAAIDVGILVGAPLIGAIVSYARQFGLPGYPTMFVCIAVLMAGSSAYYAWSSRTPAVAKGAMPTLAPSDAVK